MCSKQSNKMTIRRIYGLNESICIHCFSVYFQGYCSWALVKYDRLLLPGNPDVGVLKHKDYYYTFSSQAAAEEFSENEDR